MSRRVCRARRAETRLAIAAIVGSVSGCQLALDLGQYELEGGTAGAAGSENAVAGGGAAGSVDGAEPSGAGTSSGGAAGSALGGSGAASSGVAGAAAGSAGASTVVGIDTRLPDGGTSDAAPPGDASVSPGGCREDVECASAGECFEAVCGSDGQCEQTPRTDGDPCGDPSDAACTRPDSCDGSGVCQPRHVARGTPVSARDGDCRVVQCDGQGQTETVADNDDVPPDPAVGCTQPACLGGSPIQVPRERGTPCEVGRCDGDGACLACLGDADCGPPLPFCSGGACVECTDASQCPDPRVQCNVASCSDNRCGVAPAPLPASCDDGFFCTLDDTCNSRGFCVGQQMQCPSGAPECSEALQRCVECTSDDQCQFSCDDQGTCRS